MLMYMEKLQMRDYKVETDKRVEFIRRLLQETRSRGVVFGKKPAVLPSNFDTLCIKWRRKEMSAREVAVLCGLSLRAFYKKAKFLRLKG